MTGSADTEHPRPPAGARPARSRPTVFDEVVAGLQRLIDTGEVAVGGRLPSERDLASLLGVNRSSLREALRSLQAMGLVDIRHGIGVFVRGRPAAGAGPGQPALAAPPAPGSALDAEVLLDVVEARRVIEGAVAALAAGRATGEALAGLEAMVAADEEALERGQGSVEADNRFHLELARAAGNRLFHAALELAYGVAAPQVGRFYGGAQARAAIGRHRRLIAALRAGDADGARTEMEAHLDEVTAAWAAFESADAPQAAPTDDLPDRR